MQSSVAHFLMPTDISEEASAWLLSQGIQHDLNDLYIMGLQPTGGTLISIADPKAALAFGPLKEAKTATVSGIVVMAGRPGKIVM